MRVCIAVNITICVLLRQHIMMLWEESEEKQGKNRILPNDANDDKLIQYMQNKKKLFYPVRWT